MSLTLADGVFDPLHTGHLAYLEACEDFGDPVVVQVSEQTKRQECLPREVRRQLVHKLGFPTYLFPSTLEALRELRPARYVKGSDWRDKTLPEAAECARMGIEVVFVDTPRLSSTRLLEDWAGRTAWNGLDALQAAAQAQVVVPFDPQAQGYGSFGARLTIEGRHPEILAELCKGKSVLDVGCGPGWLVTMLRHHGANAFGVDPHVKLFANGFCATLTAGSIPRRSSDVVICREVLEHLPVREIGAFLYHLFRVARERVYLTTRFTANPRHPYDLTTEFQADPSHITLLPQPFIRSLCVTMGGIRDEAWEEALDWQQKGRVLVYHVGAKV